LLGSGSVTGIWVGTVNASCAVFVASWTLAGSADVDDVFVLLLLLLVSELLLPHAATTTDAANRAASTTNRRYRRMFQALSSGTGFVGEL
jgi:hypothetical protein